MREVLNILIFFVQNVSNVVGEDFLVLKVLFERNAASHDSGEFHVIHRTAAGIRS